MTNFLRIIGITLFFIFSLLSLSFSQEQLTITTYYPSPFGSYQELRTDQLSIGAAYRNVNLADGNVVVSGNAGVGTTNLVARLVVNGDTAVTGDILARYDEGANRGCIILSYGRNSGVTNCPAGYWFDAGLSGGASASGGVFYCCRNL